MARIEPFAALRPKKELVAKIAAPPYDVLSSQEAREMVRDNPYSFLHIGKPEVDLDPEIDLYDSRVYEKGKENFETFIKNGWLFQDESECFYLYKQVWRGHSQIGLVAVASCQDYETDIIKKHELTREEKENDRLRHIRTLNAQTGPVFLAYRDNAEMEEVVEEQIKNQPEYHFQTADKVEHTFWVIRESTVIEKIKSIFTGINPLYVADGHHRSAAAVRLKRELQQSNPAHNGNEEYNFFLSVIFPQSQLKILPYNRVLKDLNGLSREEFLNRLEENFIVAETSLQQPEELHQFCLYIEGRWYLLTARRQIIDENDPIARLDVSILQNHLLKPILAIDNPRTDKRIDFVGGIRGSGELIRLVDSGKFKLAFSLRATTMEQLLQVADSGKIMPPKSTWFEPKLKDGLASHLLD